MISQNNPAATVAVASRGRFLKERLRLQELAVGSELAEPHEGPECDMSIVFHAESRKEHSSSSSNSPRNCKRNSQSSSNNT